MKRLLLPMLLVLFIVGCDKEQTSTENPLTGVRGSAKTGKVDVCHNGMIINVNGNSVSSHRAHGDAIDLDGDGFFDIDNSCSITDCDDASAEVNELCCHEFIEATVGFETLYDLATGDTCVDILPFCISEEKFDIRFEYFRSEAPHAALNWNESFSNLAYIFDKSFCELSCSDVANYSFCNYINEPNEACAVPIPPPTDFVGLLQDADGNLWAVEYLSESETENEVTFRYRQLADCHIID